MEPSITRPDLEDYDPAADSFGSWLEAVNAIRASLAEQTTTTDRSCAVGAEEAHELANNQV